MVLKNTYLGKKRKFSTIKNKRRELQNGKNGKSIKFQVDGICYCKYYQNYGSGTFSNLNGWVTRKGVWHYSKENKLLSITMDSEISYYYDISDLSSTTVTLKLSSDSPAGTSIVYSANPLYR